MSGGKSPSYSGGHGLKLVLKVKPDNKNIPIDIINFLGTSIVMSGDYISAKIPLYKEQKITRGSGFGQHTKQEILYFERDFNSEESSIELAILSEDGKILRRVRSVDYQEFT